MDNNLARGLLNSPISRLDSSRTRMTSLDTLECFAVDVSDFVATVSMNVPPVNAQNRRFREELLTVFDVLVDREDVRAIVLTGRGKTFSAGADLKERPGIGAEPGSYIRHN